jgi:hypothetical protein
MREFDKLETRERETQELDNAPSIARPTMARSSLLVPFVVGVVMLGIGLLAGYFGRPLVNPEPTTAPAVSSADSGNQAAARSASPAVPDSSGPALMDGVITRTRHFKGEPSAPITIIEFGDFQ